MSLKTKTDGFGHRHERLMRRAYSGMLIGAILWCGAIIAAPLLAGMKEPFASAGSGLYAFFGPVCHQFDTHSFHLAGAKFGVCIRCFSIYASFTLGLMAYPFVRHIQRFPMRDGAMVMIAMAPMAIDVLLSMAGLHSSTTVSRVITGSVFGLTAAIVLTPIGIEGIYQVFMQSTHTSHQR